MSRHILKCSKCGSYTMKDACPKCDSPAFSTAPAKYSPEDRMGMYRRIAKKEIKDNS